MALDMRKATHITKTCGGGHVVTQTASNADTAPASQPGAVVEVYRMTVANSCHNGLSNCLLHLKMQRKCSLLLSHKVLNGFGFWQQGHSVCVHVGGIWYHETATTDFDKLDCLFHVQSYAVS